MSLLQKLIHKLWFYSEVCLVFLASTANVELMRTFKLFPLASPRRRPAIVVPWVPVACHVMESSSNCAKNHSLLLGLNARYCSRTQIYRSLSKGGKRPNHSRGYVNPCPGRHWAYLKRVLNNLCVEFSVADINKCYSRCHAVHTYAIGIQQDSGTTYSKDRPQLISHAILCPIDPTIGIGSSISTLPHRIRLEPGPSTTIAESDASCRLQIGV